MIAKRSWLSVLAVPVALATLTLVGANKPSPITAGGVIDPTCTSSLPCIEYDNNSNGPGVRGVSLAGNGLIGFTKFNSTSAANGRFGIGGNDLSTSGSFNAGVRGISVRGVGVAGQSTDNAGVQGNSINNNGVFGDSQSGSASGVYGQNDGGGYGVAGRVTQIGSAAVLADAGATGDFGLEALSSNSTAVVAQTGAFHGVLLPFVAAVAGLDRDAFGRVGVGAISDNGIAFEGVSGGSKPVLTLTTNGTGNLITAQAGATQVMLLDNAGNMHAHSFTADLAAATGQKLVTYSQQASEPMIEDFGEAQLTSGSAFVHLESRFAATMARANYLVFITPEGDNRGLYVTDKTPTEFVVRESQGGHSTLAFSYRIVAKPFGNQAARLPIAIEDRVTRPAHSPLQRH